jgi:hypothetical protein
MGVAGERLDTGAMPLLSSGELYRRAHKIEALCRIVMECTAGGSHRADRQRAAMLMSEIGAIAGEKDSDT